MSLTILSHILLALVWLFLTETFTLLNFVIGIGVGLAAIVLSNRIRMSLSYLKDLSYCARLFALFAFRVVQANFILARDIVLRPQTFHHSFLAIDVRSMTTGRKVLLGYMISLTPGTLVLDYGEDDATLYIHSLYGDDNEKIRRQISTFIRYLNAIHSRPS